MSAAGQTTGGLPGRVLEVARELAVRYGLGIAIIAVWEYATRQAGSLFFPPPSEIIRRTAELWLSGPPQRLFLGDGVFRDVGPSLARLLGGWALAVTAGVPLGVLIGRSRTLGQYIDAPLQFLRALPSPALIPVFIILLGTESVMRVALIAFGSVWPILLNTVEGTRTVDPVQVDTARSFRLPTHARLLRVDLPAASPKILAGMRVSLAIAVILMVVSELVASTNGVGHMIQNAQLTWLITDMWCGIVLLALIGFALNWLFVKLEDRLLGWHRGARGRAESS